jgi:hypothetical protein
MKIFVQNILTLLLSLFFNNLSAQAIGKTTVDWMPDTLYFENIDEGYILLDSFQVTNTGESPYLIREVKTSCDCTVIKYPKEPLLPGETAAIRIEFDTAGKAGLAQPGFVIYDNSRPNSRSIIYLSGYIIPRKKPKDPLGGN